VIRIAMAVLSAALILGACGYGDRPSAPGPITIVPGPGFNVAVTEKDHAVTIRSGDKLEVVLHATSGMSDWSGVSADDPTVLRPVPTGITAARGVTIAGFEALKRGTAHVGATATPLCSPGQACAMLAMLYELTVTVV